MGRRLRSCSGLLLLVLGSCVRSGITCLGGNIAVISSASADGEIAMGSSMVLKRLVVHYGL